MIYFQNLNLGSEKNVSTETALIHFIDFVHKGLTDKQNVGAVFMDLSKAFYIMNHDSLELISILDSYESRTSQR